MSEIVKVSHPALQRQTVAPLEFTPEQRKMILNSFLNGATESEAGVLLELARVRRLNPITQQIHFVQRWNAQRKSMTWAAQVGIDGFRAIAERTGLYDGQDEPEFEYEGKALKSCKVRVYRKDWSRPVVGVAHFNEYAQRTKEGALTKMWAEKPHIMLAKCAEALAIRKAFPDDASGLHAEEEMGEESEEREINPLESKPHEVVLGTRAARLNAEISAKKVTIEDPPPEPTKPPVRRMLIEDVVDEPKPPPTPPAPALKPLPDADFGDLSKPLSELTNDELASRIALLRKVKNPGKKTATKMDAIIAEQLRRNVEPPPLSDADAPPEPGAEG